MFLEGRVLADKIIKELAGRSTPKGELCIVFVGSDAISALYVSKKKEVADELGVDFRVLSLPAAVSQDELIVEIEKLNQDPKVSGILIQMPLPTHINREEVAAKIQPDKDVDGFHCILENASSDRASQYGSSLSRTPRGNSGSISRLAAARSKSIRCVPPTVLAIDELLDFYQIEKKGKKILIVGRGFLVGRPLETFWRNEDYNVETVDNQSEGNLQKIKSAEIVVVATGGGGKFFAHDFAPGAVVVDASTVAEDGGIRGDVDPTSWPDDRHLAPTPGGVGPVTVAMLFRNFYSLEDILNQ